MKKLTHIIALTLLLLCASGPAVFAMVTPSDAEVVASSWVDMIIELKGDWAGSETAEVLRAEEILRGDRLIGYHCPVNKGGYLIVSVLEGLAPVKIYSTTGEFDIDSDENYSDYIKSRLEKILDRIESELGPVERVGRTDLSAILEIDYSSVWDDMKSGTFSLQRSNYHEGGVLVTSFWHQNAPYNDQTPAGNNCVNTLVGCVATAGSQIMRHWNWPPYGVGAGFNDYYDWENILDEHVVGEPAVNTNAVAELCSEVGEAVGMNYGCGSSVSLSSAMDPVYENTFRYANSNVVQRSNYTAVGWFNRMKNQFSANRPIHQGIPNHSILGDGWQEFVPGLKFYHFNYGWGGGSNAWYALDGLLVNGANTGDFGYEYMVENIRPGVALGSDFTGWYPKENFNYRYFDMDTVGSNATFAGNQKFQFLPNVTVGCEAGDVEFNGNNTLFFARGNQHKGAKILGNAALKIYSGGEVVLR